MTTAPALVARGANCRRHLGAGRGQHDVDAAKVEGFEVLDLEDVVLAERDLSADRARRGQRHDLVGGKVALGEGRQHLAPDIAGGADHRYFEAHRRNSAAERDAMMVADLRCQPALYKHRAP